MDLGLSILHMALENGIPSHDTLQRVWSMIDPKEFERCFCAWVEAVCQKTNGEIKIIVLPAIGDDTKVFEKFVNRECDIVRLPTSIMSKNQNDIKNCAQIVLDSKDPDLNFNLFFFFN